MPTHEGVMVFCETKQGKLAAIATEALGCGRKLADALGQELDAVVLGSGVSNLAQEVISFGADKAYVLDAPLLKEYQTDACLIVMEKMVKQVMPQVLIMGKTSVGRDLSPMAGL